MQGDDANWAWVPDPLPPEPTPEPADDFPNTVAAPAWVTDPSLWGGAPCTTPSPF